MSTEYIRLNDMLMGCWDRLKNKPEAINGLPVESQIDPKELSEIWDNCFLVHVTEGRKGYKYDFLGKNLIDAYGEDIDRDTVDALVSPKSHKVIETFEEAVKLKKPISDKGEFTNSRNMLIKYRQLILPFSGGDGKVRYILGGMRWKAF